MLMLIAKMQVMETLRLKITKVPFDKRFKVPIQLIYEAF